MAKIKGQFLILDDNTLRVLAANELSVKYDPAGAITGSVLGLDLKAAGVKESHLDAGVNPDQISGESIPLEDVMSLFGGASVEGALNQCGSKMLLFPYTKTAFAAKLIEGSITPIHITDVLDTAIKAITNHNAGQGSSSIRGVVVNSTKPYIVPIRDSETQDVIEDGNGNEVYGRLEYSGVPAKYKVSFWSKIAGTETAYEFNEDRTIDFAYVFFSEYFLSLPWGNVFNSFGWHDVAEIAQMVSQSDVEVSGMLYLLAGAVTQEQVNIIVDSLGNIAAGKGADLIAYDSSAAPTGSPLDGQVTAGAGLRQINLAIGNRVFAQDNNVVDGASTTSNINALDIAVGSRVYTFKFNISDGEAVAVSLDSLDGAVGSRIYTQHRFVVDGETLSTSINVLDVNLGNAHDYIGDRLYTQNNYILDLETLTASLDKLDIGLANVASGAGSAKVETDNLTLTATDITNGYKQLNFQVAGNVVNNVVYPVFIIISCPEGSEAVFLVEAVILVNDPATAYYICWINNALPPDTSNGAPISNSAGFGDLLAEGDHVNVHSEKV